MIKIEIMRDREEVIKGYKVTGHSRYREKGEDIVCAAISALSLTGMMAGEKLASAALTEEPREGYVTFRAPEQLDYYQKRDLQIIMETVVIGMYQTARNYPGTITIYDEGGEYTWY